MTGSARAAGDKLGRLIKTPNQVKLLGEESQVLKQKLSYMGKTVAYAATKSDDWSRKKSALEAPVHMLREKLD